MTIAEQKALRAYTDHEGFIFEDERKAYIKGYNEAITDAVDRLNEALDIDGSYLRELLTEPEKL